MSRYRLHPTPAQEEALLDHCAHTRYVWNLAVEQRSWWQPGRPAPGFATQCRQLTEARAVFPWLATGSVIVQQQALRDFHAAWASYFAALREWRRRYARTAGRAARPAWPAQLAQARAGRGLPGRRDWTTGRATAEPQVGAGAGPQARLGPLPLVPAGARGQVPPGDPRPRRPLARCLLRRPLVDPWTRDRGGRGDRPGGDGDADAVGRPPLPGPGRPRGRAARPQRPAEGGAEPGDPR